LFDTLLFLNRAPAPSGQTLKESAEDAYALVLDTMRTSFVPQVGQVPCREERPFLSMTGRGSTISFAALHLTQNAVVLGVVAIAGFFLSEIDVS